MCSSAGGSRRQSTGRLLVGLRRVGAWLVLHVVLGLQRWHAMCRLIELIVLRHVGQRARLLSPEEADGFFLFDGCAFGRADQVGLAEGGMEGE
jgi:hypothetical protein